MGGREQTQAALNLGGIANLTVLPEQSPPLAFDVGPANALIDAAVEHFTQGSETYDRDGRRAARGRIHQRLLESLLDDAYFDLEPPKSTGKEHFNLSYLTERLESLEHIEDDDVIATLTATTARTIEAELSRFDVAEVVVSGGGTSNPTLMGMLQSPAQNVEVRLIEDWGIPSHSKEAYAFATLGFLTLNGVPGRLPSCTGARHATVLGNVTPGGSVESCVPAWKRSEIPEDRARRITGPTRYRAPVAQPAVSTLLAPALASRR